MRRRKEKQVYYFSLPLFLAGGRARDNPSDPRDVEPSNKDGCDGDDHDNSRGGDEGAREDVEEERVEDNVHKDGGDVPHQGGVGRVVVRGGGDLEQEDRSPSLSRARRVGICFWLAVRGILGQRADQLGAIPNRGQLVCLESERGRLLTRGGKGGKR